MIVSHNDFSGKKILILGYGVEGKATETYLRENYSNVAVLVADKNDDDDYLQRQKDCDIVIKTSGISKRLITKPYTTATNMFFEIIPKNQIIGVTGSKGKSTTASLIAHILRKSGKDVRLVGNIGKSLLSSLQKPFSSNTLFVCELSSYQLDDLQYSPHVAVITTLFPDHIPYHGSVEKYYEAKRTIIFHCDSEDYYIFNDSFLQLSAWAKKFPGSAVGIAKNTNYYDSRLLGAHNQDNIKLAVAVSSLFKISNDQIIEHIKSFKPLPHRLEKVATYGGTTFYDDAISTTPESTIAALYALKNVDTIFLGGEDRGYDFHVLAEELQKKNVSNIVAFPDSGAAILAEVKKLKNYSPCILQTNSMKEAVTFGFNHTKKDMVCLLSTASPSYSIWKNFIEKGTQFQTLIHHYAQKTQSTKT